MANADTAERIEFYLTEHERQAGAPDFDYAALTDADAEFGRCETVADEAPLVTDSFYAE